MNVCMLGYTFYENDGRVMRYAGAIAEAGGTVDVIALRRPGQESFSIIDGVNLYRVQTRYANEKSGAVNYLWRLLRFFFVSMAMVTRLHFRRRYDAIHVHSVPDFEVFAAAICKMFGARIILDIHDIVPEFYLEKFGGTKSSLLFRMLCLAEKLSIAFSDHVIAANDIWKERLTNRSCRADKLTSFINYPDPKVFHERDASPRPTTTMVYPGTINSHQGVDLVIRAMHEIRDEFPDLQFVIYGTGPADYRAELEQLIDSLDLRSRVTIHEPVPIDELADEVARCHIGVVGKRGRGFGNEAFSTKIPEMMALGVPVVIPATSIDQLYFPSDTAEFYPPDDVVGLAAALRLTLSDPDRRERKRAAALEFVADMMWNTKKQEYLDLLEG